MNASEREFYDIYRSQCDVVLECVKDKLFGYYNGRKFHADHKYSVWRGAKNDIPLEVISGMHNLELLPAKENIRKGWRCSMSKRDLFRKYMQNEKLTRLCQFVEKETDLTILARWKGLAREQRILRQRERFKARSRNRRKAKADQDILDAIPCV